MEMDYTGRWFYAVISIAALIAAGCGEVVSKLYVPNSAADSITVYAPDATGNVMPLRTISGPSTGLNGPSSVVVKDTGRLYVANFRSNSITVYEPGATGNATPSNTYTTSLGGPEGLALDPAGRLYVANSSTNSITVYTFDSYGNLVQIGSISGTNTLLNGPTGVVGDSDGTLYVTNSGANSVTVYAPGAVGAPGLPSANVAPLRTLSGANTQLSFPHGVSLDVSHTLYVVNQGTGSVTVYAPGAGGAPGSAAANVAPLRTLSGASTQLVLPVGLAMDVYGTLYVSNNANPFGGSDNSITVYSNATGNATPLRTITGSSTGLNQPGFISLGGP
jgi:6-phosphogluconolactonase (cycloisomerase 2 family)